MNKDMNNVNLIGRAVRDAELRHIPSGTAVSDVTLAVNDIRGAGDDKKEDVSFINCIFWSGKAEAVSKWLKKGHKISVQGRLNQKTWDDQKTGDKRSSVEVIVNEFQFLQPKGDQQGTENRKESAPEQESMPSMGNTTKPFDQDDIPFAPNVC